MLLTHIAGASLGVCTVMRNVLDLRKNRLARGDRLWTSKPMPCKYWTGN